MRKIRQLLNEIWNNSTALISISIVIAILFLPIFYNAIAFYLILLLFAVGISWGLCEKYYHLFQMFERVLLIALIIVILLTATIGIKITAIFKETYPSSENNNDTIDGWTKCYKCHQTGKIKNDLGYYISCPRCNGVGYLPD